MRPISFVLAVLVAAATFAGNGLACTLDRTFAGSGFAATPLPGQQGSAAVVVRDAQGRYLVAGESDAMPVPGPLASGSIAAGSSVHVARYLPNGQLDTTFGGTGVSRRFLDAPASTMMTDAIAVDDSGGAFVLLRSLSSVTTGAVLLHVKGDGTWDVDFGGPTSAQGKVQVGCGAQSPWISPDLVRDEQGRLVVSAATDPDVSLMRLHADGTRDTTFGTNGCASHPQLPRSVVTVVRRPTGYELVGNEAGGLWTFRVDEAGAADAGYGTGGFVHESLPASVVVSDAALQGNRLVLELRASQSISVARLDPLGRLDLTFGNAGYAGTPPGFRVDSNFAANTVAIAADGRIALGGRPTQVSGQLGIALFGPNGDPIGRCSPGAFDFPDGRINDGNRGVAFDGDRLVVAGGNWNPAASRHEPNVFVVATDVLLTNGFE